MFLKFWVAQKASKMAQKASEYGNKAISDSFIPAPSVDIAYLVTETPNWY